jgi:hypothetical protein
VKKVLLMAFAMAAMIPALSIPASADAAGTQQTRTLRGQLVHQIVMKWGGYVHEAYRGDVRRWAMDMVPLFSRASIETLEQAAKARSFQTMNDAFLGDRDGIAVAQNDLVVGNKGAVTKALGDNASDLVFVPVTPCRIIDTRVAGGVIAANTVRSFDITAIGSYAAQGGEATDCNGVGSAPSFAAAAINFTVVTPSAGGYITAFPFLATQPTAATVNYTAGDIRGNFAIVKLDQGASANELSVYSFAQTHLVADIVGYFIEPQVTALECVEKLSSGTTIAAGSFGTQSTASCDAGYTIAGGGCSMSNFDGRVVTTRTIVSGSSQTHFCAFRNEGGGTVDGLAYARCCRTPGRL